ncbi:ATP-binding protein [Phytohabitans sp. LJ34]|uniref:ATP-binding protein n=1 Tax=Phytohabitans sp. LJ34 TaxID=3452217 RepID=UPI003F898572
MNGTANAEPVDELRSVLGRLDEVLAAAVVQAEAAFAGRGPDPYRGLYVDGPEVRRLLVREPGEPPLGPVGEHGGLAVAPGPVLRRMLDGFDLTPFDLDLVVIALAPEFDLKYERLFGYLQDDVTRRRPTVDLALNLLCGTAGEKLGRRAHLAPDAPLRRHGLVGLTYDPGLPEPPLLAHSLRPAPELVWLLCGGAGPASGHRLLTPAAVPPATTAAIGAGDPLAPAVAALGASRKGEPAPRLYLRGPSRVAARDAVHRLAGVLGLPVVDLDVEAALDVPAALTDRLDAALREAGLRAAMVCLSGFDALLAATGDGLPGLRQAVLSAVAGCRRPVVFAGTRRWTVVDEIATPVVEVTVPLPDFETRQSCWTTRLRAVGAELAAADIRALAGRFRFTADQIERTVAAAAYAATLRDGAPPHRADLFAAARAGSGPGLANLAVRVRPTYRWDDLVLPADRLAQLREVCQHVEWRHTVFDRWGFDRRLSLGKGLTVLFAGPSGTGKTMAAEVIANELGLDLYKIDLSQVISKYIGETEQRLERIFVAAQESNAILFFDEADAIFGKRSEVRDAHDRYANIETSYLLQRMEAYEGTTILATNLRRNLDEAFLRRLSFAVDFPHPGAAQRLEIWRKVWPAEAPREAGLDLAFMAQQFELPGGHIRNVALNAAFLAAANGGVVAMPHLLAATQREYQKLGRLCVAEDFGPYQEMAAEGGLA